MSTNTVPIALVTGGSRGLGKSTALHLAKRGTDVILTYKSGRAEAEATVAEIEAMGRRAHALPLDVSKSTTFVEFAIRLRDVLSKNWQRDKVNFLVNNAGIGIHANFADTTEAQFDELVNIHLKGVFFLTQKLLPLLADGGRIVNISSGLTRFALPGYSAYAAMKGAIEVLSRYMAKELGQRRIAVNTVAPGAIETDFGGGMVRDDAHINAMIASQTALGRVGLPYDIRGVIPPPPSPQQGWVTTRRPARAAGTVLLLTPPPP